MLLFRGMTHFILDTCKTVILANSEDPDEISHDKAAFH